MKKLFDVLVLVLALNFLATLGAVGWLFQSKKLDKQKLGVLKELVFESPKPPEVLATQPSEAATQPSANRLNELLSKYAGARTDEQIELIQQSIDTQFAALDRRSRELDNLTGQVLREKQELAQKTQALEQQRTGMTEERDRQSKQVADKGFADSLKLYSSMPTKQSKAAFQAMPADQVARYLQAMPPRTASKIVKEFKTPDEQAFVARVMDQVRRGDAPATRPASDGTDAASADASARMPAGTSASTSGSAASPGDAFGQSSAGGMNPSAGGASAGAPAAAGNASTDRPFGAAPEANAASSAAR